MIVKFTNHAAKQFHKLPRNIQNKTKKQFHFLLDNFQDPSLHTRRMAGLSRFEGRIESIIDLHLKSLKRVFLFFPLGLMMKD